MAVAFVSGATLLKESGAKSLASFAKDAAKASEPELAEVAGLAPCCEAIRKLAALICMAPTYSNIGFHFLKTSEAALGPAPGVKRETCRKSQRQQADRISGPHIGPIPALGKKFAHCPIPRIKDRARRSRISVRMRMSQSKKNKSV